MTTARDIYVVGLRNAHAMEIQARELMERQSERLGDYPGESRTAPHRDQSAASAAGNMPRRVRRDLLNPEGHGSIGHG